MNNPEHPLIQAARAVAGAVQELIVCRDHRHDAAQKAMNLAARDIVGELSALPPGPLVLVRRELVEQAIERLDGTEYRRDEEVAASLRASLEGGE